MSDGRMYYCYCDSNCKFETMTKEQILAAIAQAVETGSVGDCDTGFITKVKEQNSGSCVTLWVGTRAQYNAIAEKAKNCMYIITDDTTGADIVKACANANEFANEALTLAANADEIARTALAAVNRIDISDLVSLSWVVSGGGQNLTTLEVVKQFVYYPAFGIVAYKIGITYDGTMAANEIAEFAHAGGYAPNSWHVNTPAACYTGQFNADDFAAAYVGSVTAPRFCLKTKNSVDTKGEAKGVTVAGWYFCDGE